MFFKESTLLTENEITAFTQGDCTFFAETIVNLSPDDFSMVLVTDLEDDDSIENSCYHVVAEHISTGLLLDAQGIWDYEALLKHHETVFCGDSEIFTVEYSMDLYYDQGGSNRAYSEDTVEPAKKLLNAFNTFLKEHTVTQTSAQ